MRLRDAAAVTVAGLLAGCAAPVVQPSAVGAAVSTPPSISASPGSTVEPAAPDTDEPQLETSSTTRGQIGKTLHADLDGDGLADTVTLTQGPDNGVALVGRTAKTSARSEFGEFELVRLIGTYDVDGDGRNEVLAITGGATASLVGILRFDGDAWSWLTMRETNPDGASYNSHEFPVFAHSMCCADASMDLECRVVDGQPSLVLGETRSYSDLRDINYVINATPCTVPTSTMGKGLSLYLRPLEIRLARS